MCKIMVMSGIDKDTVDNAWKFVKAVAKEMSFGNKDGLGYAAIAGDGELFGERWLKNDDAFDSRNPLTDLEMNIIKKHKGVLSKPITYNKFGGVQEDNMRSITLHARLATSGKDFYNTHPFVVDNTSLIHNGVVKEEKLTLCQSTCDSEGILNEYIKHDVANNIEHIQKLADKVEGSYACGVFSETSDGTKILDIFKENSTSLHAAWIKELNSLVFATTLQVIKDACRSCDLTIVSDFNVRGGHIWRYNAISGELLQVFKFDPYRVHKERKGGSTTYSGPYWKDVHSTHGESKGTAITTHPRVASSATHTPSSVHRTIDDFEEWEYMKNGVWKKTYERR